MARSLLGSFVSGTRAMLTLQLFVSVTAVALAGWTLSVTNSVIRERDRLRDRVIQLEETMASRGIVVPSAPAVVQTPAQDANAYPSPIGPQPAEASADSQPTEAAAADEPRGITDMIGDAFGPTPPLRILVLHARSREDEAMAQRVAREMGSDELRIVVNLMEPHDARQSGYAYFDGRQSRAAADIVTRFHEISRRAEIAPWSAQLRGIALPSQGEYTPDRLDIVLPPLPVEAAPAPPAAIRPRG